MGNFHMQAADHYRFRVAGVLSLTLHIFVILLFLLLNQFGLLDLFKQNQATPVSQPIVMELEPPAPQPQPQPQPTEPLPPEPAQPDQVPFVENEEADLQKPEFGLLSEKDSRSAAPDADRTGDAAAPDVPKSENPPVGEELEKAQALADLKGTEAVVERGAQRVFSKNYLTGNTESRVQRPASEFREGLSQISEPEEKPFEIGNFRLSTVNWDYVPWLEAFKGRLLFVWIAPAAYHMGLIEGYTVIRFRVSRAGELLGYDVLEHHGHESLQGSSENAIESVFPFRPLPDHFPDEVLEITGSLIYPGPNTPLPRR